MLLQAKGGIVTHLSHHTAMMILLFLMNFILPSSNAMNETDTRKFCFLPTSSTVPRTVITTTNALSLPGCHVPCALNANCQACSYNAATLKCTLLGPQTPVNSCSEPYTAYEKHTTGCTDMPIPHSNASYTLSKCLSASDVIGPPPFVRVSPVCGNATANLRRVAYDTILHDGTRWVLENHRDSFIDWDEKIGSWYFNIGVAVYYFYAATCVKVPATQLPGCGCAALASEPAMAGYVTTGVAAATEQPPPVCAGQVQFRISRASAPSASQTVMNGAYRSIYCAMGTWMQMIDNGSSWYNEWSLSAATCVAKSP